MLAGLAFSLAFATSAQAASINGSFALAGIGVTQNGADLSVSTLINMTDTITTSGGAGDFAPIPLLTSFGAVTLNLASLVDLANNFSLFNATYGDFDADTAVIVQRTANFLDIYFEGMYNPGAGLGNPALVASPASVRVSVNQNGVSLSSALTVASPPAGIPEPSTVSFLALGCAAIGFGALRRRSA